MPLTGKDVWDAIVKAGLLSGPYEPRTNLHCRNADVLASLLNEVSAGVRIGCLVASDRRRNARMGSHYAAGVGVAALQVSEPVWLYGRRN